MLESILKKAFEYGPVLKVDGSAEAIGSISAELSLEYSPILYAISANSMSLALVVNLADILILLFEFLGKVHF